MNDVGRSTRCRHTPKTTAHWDWHRSACTFEIRKRVAVFDGFFIKALHLLYSETHCTLAVTPLWKIRLVLKCGLVHINANANERDESNASANANAQQLNQMQMQMHLDQMQMHLDQMQMLFYNYVFCVHKWYFAKLFSYYYQ